MPLIDYQRGDKKGGRRNLIQHTHLGLEKKAPLNQPNMTNSKQDFNLTNNVSPLVADSSNEGGALALQTADGSPLAAVLITTKLNRLPQQSVVARNTLNALQKSNDDELQRAILSLSNIKSAQSNNNINSTTVNREKVSASRKNTKSEKEKSLSSNEKIFKFYDNEEAGAHKNNERAAEASTCKHRTRIHVALLGLAIAVVNCYAQATSYIAIVEMVLPADYVVLKSADSGSANQTGQLVKVIVSDKSGSLLAGDDQHSFAGAGALSNETTAQLLQDYSCPVEYKYRHYYDAWRFPNNLNQSMQQSTTSNTIDVSDRFDWDASRQGLLLGAFAVGTAPLQVLGGRLAEIYGAKWVLLAGCVGTALTNLTVPFLARFSFALLIVNRVLMGVAQAGMEPGLMCLLAQWLTPTETGFFISMLLFAICIGFFLGSLCSSFLLTLGYGWPLTYYVSGGVNLALAVVWLFYASSRPSESRLISPEELQFIQHEQQVARLAKKNQLLEGEQRKENNDLKRKTIANDGPKPKRAEQRNISHASEAIINTSNNRASPTDNSTTKNQLPKYHFNVPAATLMNESHSSEPLDANLDHTQAPWLNILSTPSVWAFIVCKISIRWSADVISIELPSYLANVLHLSIKLNGILNSISSALFAIFSFLTGYLVNEILERQAKKEANEANEAQLFAFKLSKTNLRKMFQSVASFGSAICVFLMTQYDCNILFSMSMLLVSSCCLVMGTGGELQIPYDMTSRYPGTLHGMACTLSVSGWLAPPLIGLILGDQPSSRFRWSIVWYLTAFINLVGGLVFVLFADASPRDFDGSSGGTKKSARGSATQKGATQSCDPGSQQEEPSEHPRDNSNQQDIIKRNAQAIAEAHRGRHLASYCNMACKSTDSSQQQTHRSALFLNNASYAEAAQNYNQFSSYNCISDTNNNNNNKDQLEQSWSYFDRDLIRIRQVEESFIKPSYLHDFDSIAAQNLIFPYCTQVGKSQMTSATSQFGKNQHHYGNCFALERSAAGAKGQLRATSSGLNFAGSLSGGALAAIVERLRGRLGRRKKFSVAETTSEAKVGGSGVGAQTSNADDFSPQSAALDSLKRHVELRADALPHSEPLFGVEANESGSRLGSTLSADQQLVPTAELAKTNLMQAQQSLLEEKPAKTITHL